MDYNDLDDAVTTYFWWSRDDCDTCIHNFNEYCDYNPEDFLLCCCLHYLTTHSFDKLKKKLGSIILKHFLFRGPILDLLKTFNQKYDTKSFDISDYKIILEKCPKYITKILFNNDATIEYLILNLFPYYIYNYDLCKIVDDFPDSNFKILIKILSKDKNYTATRLLYYLYLDGPDQVLTNGAKFIKILHNIHASMHFEPNNPLCILFDHFKIERCNYWKSLEKYFNHGVYFEFRSCNNVKPNLYPKLVNKITDILQSYPTYLRHIISIYL